MIQCPTEHEEQKTVIRWRDTVAVLRWPHLLLPDGRFPLLAIPNGGDRNAIVGRKLKAEGVMRGVPDLFLPVMATPMVEDSKMFRKVLHGLWIEMKRRRGGRVSPDQAAWHEYLERAGYRVVVARGADEAIAATEEYLG